MACTKKFVAPTTDMLYAFENGTFGYLALGYFPIKDDAHTGGYAKDGTLKEVNKYTI